MKKIIFAVAALMLLASCGTSNTETTTTGSTVSASVQAQLDSLNPNPPSYGSGGTVVEIYADFQCPACQLTEQQISPTLEKLADEGKIAIHYRQFPLTTIHKNAMNDALSAMCAQDQGKYFEFKKALYAFETQKAGASVTDEERVNLAKETGLDGDTFATCLSEKKFQEYVNNDMKRAELLGVTGTPTYFLDGKKLNLSTFNTIAELEAFLQAYVEKKTK